MVVVRKRGQDESLSPRTRKQARTFFASPPVTPDKTRIKDLTNILTNNNFGVKNLAFNTPPTSPTKPKNTSIYSQAKALFQRSSSQEGSGTFLVGREEEAAQLNKFLCDNIISGASNSLYISGPPGTGKTAQCNLSFKHLGQQYGNQIKIVRINCMAVFKPENIFHEIYCLLDTSKLSMSYGKKKTSKDLLEYLTTKQENPGPKTVILLLDELDYLITKDQQVLFQLFNFVSVQLETKLIIVSISNALDLTDKFLPRLKSNNLSPEALQFLPYSSEQIKKICIEKLKSLNKIEEENGDDDDKENNYGTVKPVNGNSIPIIHPAAIQLCCKKSASVTGDLRKAFDICYKGIEMVENGLRKTETIEKINSYNITNAPKVLISHIAKVCASSFGENVSTRLTNLNLLQKAILCSLVNLQTMRSGDTFTVNQFYDHYSCNSTEQTDRLLGKLKKVEFLEVVGALESVSVIALSSTIQHQETSGKHIRASVLYMDVSKAVTDIGVLQRILNKT